MLFFISTLKVEGSCITGIVVITTSWTVVNKLRIRPKTEGPLAWLAVWIYLKALGARIIAPLDIHLIFCWIFTFVMGHLQFITLRINESGASPTIAKQKNSAAMILIRAIALRNRIFRRPLTLGKDWHGL